MKRGLKGETAILLRRGRDTRDLSVSLCTHRGKTMWRLREKVPSPTHEEKFHEKHPCGHLDLEFPDSRTMRKYISVT